MFHESTEAIPTNRDAYSARYTTERPHQSRGINGRTTRQRPHLVPANVKDDKEKTDETSRLT